MSKNYHAGQYEDVFSPTKMSNWEVCHNYPARIAGTSHKGFTQPVANDRGHTTNNNKKDCRKSGFSNFVGTWDLPKRIIVGPKSANPMGRSPAGMDKMREGLEELSYYMNGKKKMDDRCRQANLPGPSGQPAKQKQSGHSKYPAAYHDQPTDRNGTPMEFGSQPHPVEQLPGTHPGSHAGGGQETFDGMPGGGEVAAPGQDAGGRGSRGTGGAGSGLDNLATPQPPTDRGSQRGGAGAGLDNLATPQPPTDRSSQRGGVAGAPSGSGRTPQDESQLNGRGNKNLQGYGDPDRCCQVCREDDTCSVCYKKCDDYTRKVDIKVTKDQLENIPIVCSQPRRK